MAMIGLTAELAMTRLAGVGEQALFQKQQH
jgi:hypothetical protein